jgi:hypothetical protein
MPPADLVDQLLPGAAAGAPIREAEQTHTRAEAALAALTAGRPGGSAWESAREADRAAILDGREPDALAALLAGEHARYATANALCSATAAVAARAREQLTQSAGLRGALRAAEDQAVIDHAKAAARALAAAVGARKADAYAALDRAEVARQRAAALQSLTRWLDGEQWQIAPTAYLDGAALHRVALARRELGDDTTTIVSQPGTPVRRGAGGAFRGSPRATIAPAQ